MDLRRIRGTQQGPDGRLQKARKHGAHRGRPENRPEMGRGTIVESGEVQRPDEDGADQQEAGRSNSKRECLRLRGVHQARTHPDRILEPGPDQEGDLRADARQVSRT